MQKLAEFVYIVSSDNHIDVRIRFYKLFGKITLLSHTAAHGDDHMRFRGFEFFKHSDIAESVLLGVFSHATGVENYHVRVLGFFTFRITHPAENSCDFFRFVYVHLATVRMYNVIIVHKHYYII